MEIDEIRDFIIKTRNMKKYSQRILSEKSGVSEGVIARFEVGKRDIGFTDLNRLLNTLGYKLIVEFVDENTDM
jgi:predicted transcriptional regulator